jgi:hypothetical protein
MTQYRHGSAAPTLPILDAADFAERGWTMLDELGLNRQ